uniref:3'-5' exonuclease domain-containing protein n=1 Tax=Acrobeloides nanus TaxID=290746 RepID=A0A914EAI2_9BILA
MFLKKAQRIFLPTCRHCVRNLATSSSLYAKAKDQKPDFIGKAQKLLDLAFEAYASKKYHFEQLDDIIFTTLSQQPDLKNHVVTQLKEKYKDEKVLKKLAHSFNQSNRRNGVWNKEFEKVDLYEAKPGFLALPKDVAVHLIDKIDALKLLEEKIGGTEFNKRKILALDGESSIYNFVDKNIKASTIQLALEDTVFILDLDIIGKEKSLTSFLDGLFKNNSYLKIGHHFSKKDEKIHCALPELKPIRNVVCINSIVRELYYRTYILDQKLADVIDADSDAEEKLNIVDGDIPPLIKLETFCEVLLPQKLNNKAESKSVWNRRPLRPGQIQYMATKTYSLIMIHKVCEKWAQLLKEDLNSICDEILKQEAEEAAKEFASKNEIHKSK